MENKENFQVVISIPPDLFTRNPTGNEAYCLGERSVAKRLPDIDANVHPIINVYSRKEGCPNNGEVGFLIWGNTVSANKEQLENQIALIMRDFGQSKAIVEYLPHDTIRPFASIVPEEQSSTYLEIHQNEKDGPVEVTRKTDEHNLSFKLMIKGDYSNIISTIQDMLENVKSDEYAVTGFMQYAGDALVYQGVMRKDCGQTDRQKFADAVSKIAHNPKLNCVDMYFVGNTEGIKFPQLARPDLDANLSFVGIARETIDAIDIGSSVVSQLLQSDMSGLDTASMKVLNTKFGTKEQILAMSEFADEYYNSSNGKGSHFMGEFTNNLVEMAEYCIDYGDESFRDILDSLKAQHERFVELDRRDGCDISWLDQYASAELDEIGDREF